jgi:peptidoglycan/xylan/chitin deacetylase (PgdA/CDA1 family)
MTWQEAAKMQRHGISAGAHSKSHAALDTLSDQALSQEITDSRDLISARLGAKPTAFSYPYGRADVRVSAAVEAAGFLGAVTVREGLCFPKSCPHLLPRLEVHNWNRLFFAKYLHMLSQGVAIGEPSTAFRAVMKFALPASVLAAGRRIRGAPQKTAPQPTTEG